MEEVRTYSTNTDINPEPYKPAFTLINPDAKEDYLLDGRYVVRAPKRGRWIYKKRMGYFCSACIEDGLSPTNADDKCGYSLDGEMNYCWNCGAKMDEVIGG